MKVMFIVNDLGVNEPFGPMLLSAIVKEKGHETILGSIKIDNNLQNKISLFNPDIIAYSMMTVDVPDMKKFNDKIREKTKIFTILGGPATLDHSLINDPGIDAICVGEGDGAIVEVFERLENNKELTGIPNILTSNSEENKVDLRSRVTQLDELPFMDREMVYSYPEMERFGIKGIWTNRGCAFRCPYCFNNRFNDMYKGDGTKIVRRRSVSSIIEETLELKKNHFVNIIRIQDDIFVYKADEWLREFADRFPKEIGIPFYCLIRLELISDDLLSLLKKAGCHSVAVSVESAVDKVRNTMLRRKMSLEKMENAFALLKKHKINVYNNIMLALPFTTIEDDIASVDFAIKVQPEMADFSIFMPYPGTDLGDFCRDKGIYDHENDNVYYGFKNESPLKCFDARTKRAQQNLAQLAILAVQFPFLRNLVMNRLIHWKPNKIFFFIHYLLAVYCYGARIFPYKHTLRDYAFLINKTIKFYIFDFFGKDKEEKPKEKKTFLARLPVLSRSSSPKMTMTMGDNTAPQKEDYVTTNRLDDLEKCMEAMSKTNMYASRKY
jgi:radical SAM superfamily enzyme YgiQ (UPF0313 family)